MEKDLENQQRWYKWFYPNNIKKVQALNITPIECGGFVGKVEVDSGNEFESVTIDPQSKGKLVVENFRNAYRKTKGKGYIIMIDGDGDIPFNYIFSMLKSLKEGNSLCLACRKGDLGMGETRNNIEKFELNLVENLFRVSLPDGQCGCWGTQLANYPKLGLSAEGYEIELDVLISALQNNIPFTYFPIQLSETARQPHSSFNRESHRQKLEFLVKKLGLGQDTLWAYYNMFKKERKAKLPSWYEKMLKGMKAPSPFQRKFQKCSWRKTCNRCDRK